MALLGPRAAVLQNMLPRSARGWRTTRSGSPRPSPGCSAASRRSTTPSTAPTPRRSGHEVRDFHRPIKGKLPDGSPYSALNPDTYYWAHACFVEHLITATDTFIRRLSERGEGADLRGVDHLVRAVRRELARHPADLRRVRRLLRARARRAAGRAPHRVVRRGLRDQGLAATEAGPAPVWWLVETAGQRGQLVDHDRRDAAARPRDPRPAVGRRARAPLPAVRRRLPRPRTASTGGCPVATGCTRSRCARSSARVAGPEPASLLHLAGRSPRRPPPDPGARACRG